MSGELQKKIIEYLNTKWVGSKNCPICMNNTWTVLDDIVRLDKFYENGNIVIGGGPVYPYFGVVCNKCGHTLFFNAMITEVLNNSHQFTKSNLEV